MRVSAGVVLRKIENNEIVTTRLPSGVPVIAAFS
jgi:hypothetical protein